MPFVEQERIDTLLALAIAFAEAETSPLDVGIEDVGSHNPSPSLPADFLRTLASLSADDREAIERRAAWRARLSAEQQAQWLARTLVRARPHAQSIQLDEHIHPTHVVEALRDEPPRIQAILIRQLPARLAGACASALSIKHVRRPARDAGDEPSETEAAAFVRRRFLSRFVNIEQLPNPTHLDSLSGAELARLIRLSGVREAAIACRGVAQVENIASLWRRFPAEDARAFAAHMATLIDVEPARVSFAEELVGEALGESSDPISMLDHTGMLLLALVVHAGDTKRLLHTAQKLPFSAAVWLHGISDHLSQQQPQRRSAIVRQIAGETEALATNLRRASRHGDAHSSVFEDPVI